MIRIKRGCAALKKRKKYLKLAKSYTGHNSRLSIFASEQLVQSGNFAYIGRKLKKRNFRRLWISRISAFAQLYCNEKYSNLMRLLKNNNIYLDRKMLAYMIAEDLNAIFAFSKHL